MSKASDLAKELNTALGGDFLRLANTVKKLPPVPTGLLPMDMLLHGGFPRGRMSEIYGAPSALKSYIGLCAIREAQKAGGMGALIDTERTFDPDWATAIGVDLSKLFLWPTDDEKQHVTGEEAVDAAEAILRSKQVDILVFDSVAAALPQDLQGKRLAGENVQPGRLAAMMSVGLRKLTAANQDTAILWVNQLRTNIGITFGNPEAPPGGKALPYYASIRINVKAIGKILESKKVFDGEKWQDQRKQVGTKYKATIDKSKMFAPHDEVIFTWLYGQNEIDEVSFLVAQGLERGLITQAGAMWETEGLKVRGRENFLAKLPEHPEIIERLAQVIVDGGT